MIELRDTEVAKAILRETETMQRCKNKNKMRRLEALADAKAQQRGFDVAVR